MRRLIAGAALALAFIAAASVAQVRAEGIKPEVTAEPWSDKWNRSAFYIGAVGGYDATHIEAGDLSLDKGLPFGGVVAGYNWRVDRSLVAGIEVDYMFTDINLSRTTEDVSVKASSHYLASVRGRLGLPLGPALLYGTAGVAFKDAKVAIDGDVNKDFQTGLVAGGGLSVEMTKTVEMRIEGLHYVFPDDGKKLWQSDLFSSNDRQTVGRVGLTFKLN